MTSRSTKGWAFAAAAALFLAGLTSGAQTAFAAGAEESRTLVNRDTTGAPTLRFDVFGNAIDAHDGQIQYFDGRYHLYGTAYGCGYEWNTPGAPFCGFVSYSSPDLVSWTPDGPLFDATSALWQSRCDGSTYGCYRPHVVYNASTRKYVLWINAYDNGVGYHVFTSDRPDGGFQETAEPNLAVPEGAPGGVNYGDQQVFVDHDGTAYLSFTDWRVGGDILIEKLDPTYTTGSGQWTSVGLRSTEAPTMFKRGDRYYLTYSDPNRGYATTGTGYVTATSPLGPWTGAGTVPDSWTIADGALGIVGGDVGVSKLGADWTDYTFRASVTPLKADSGNYAQAGLVFRSSDAGSYQWLIGNYPHAGAEGGNLTKIIPGRGATVVPLPAKITTGQTYDIAITVTGSTIETRIDGVLVDSTTDSTLDHGGVGFRASAPDNERMRVDDVQVTDAQGATLLRDDFSGDLSQWNRPARIVKGTNLTTTSCGGQPTDVLEIPTSAGPTYLYQSDVWMDAKANEALAKQYWAPLEFDAAGGILPIDCKDSVDVTIPIGQPGAAHPVPAVSVGDRGFRTHADISGGLQRAQEFTVPTTGVLSAVRFMSYQDNHPNADLRLDLRALDSSGALGPVLATASIPAKNMSWAASWAELRLAAPLAVKAGARYAIVASSATTTGAYGIAYSDTTPYAGGRALISNDAGASFRAETGRVLRIEADIAQATADTTRPVVTLVAPTVAGPSPDLSLRVDATDDVGLSKIVANIYKDGVLVKSTQTAAQGATAATHTAKASLPDGSYSLKYNAHDLAGNVSKTGTFAFYIDSTKPTATIKTGAPYTVEAGGGYDVISFKLFDAGKVDKVVLNGVVKDLTDNRWSDVNFIKPPTFGAVRGANTLVVFDVAGNTATYTFVLN